MSLSNAALENSFEPRIGRSVSIDHAAELLGVSRRTVYNRIRDGKLQTVRTIGGSQRVTLESVEQQGGHRPAAAPGLHQRQDRHGSQDEQNRFPRQGQND